MTRFSRSLLVLAVASVGVTACTKPMSDPGKPAADGKTAAAAPAGELKDEKSKASYVIGMEMAKSLEPIKDEVDLDILVKALRGTLAGQKSPLTDEQAAEVRNAFAASMQSKMMAKMMAEAGKNAEAGRKFLAENGKKPNVKTTASGLQYEVLTAGTGPKPTPKDMVTVQYKGSLLDGKVFDSSYERGQPAQMPLEQVVPGWREAVTLMPVGSKYRFWIPAVLGYGEAGTPGGPIPPNATLVFEVELLDIVKGKAAAAARAAAPAGH